MSIHVLYMNMYVCVCIYVLYFYTSYIHILYGSKKYTCIYVCMYVYAYILCIYILYIHTNTDFDLGEEEEDENESEDMEDDEVCSECGGGCRKCGGRM